MVIIIFLFIVPIVIKVVREKSMVMTGFAYVTKKEIDEIISWALVFDVRSTKMTFKLLAENRKDKVYEIIKMDNEEHTIKEDKKEVDEGQKVCKSSKLRNLIRSVFKFGDSSPKDDKEEDQAGFDSYLSKKQYTHEDPHDYFTDDTSKNPMKNRIEKDEDKSGKKEDDHEDSMLSLNPNKKEIKTPFDQEEIIYMRKKESLSKIDLSLRRRSLLKVSIIFILFLVYLILNLAYIIFIHSYALKASEQNNNIHMRRALMTQLSLMGLQAFFENDVNFLKSQPETRIKYLPEYRDELLKVEESILDFEKKGPKFIFPEYVKKVALYNSNQFCNELKSIEGTGHECETYDNGFFRNGLRATQFRYIAFWQGLAQRFLKEPTYDVTTLNSYRYNPEIENYSIVYC